MGLGKSTIRLWLELWQRGYLKDAESIVEIGSQWIYVSLADMENLLKSAGISFYDRENFIKLEKYPEVPTYCSTKPFYELLGIKQCASIDINKSDGWPWIMQMDLNKPLEDASLYNKYDLVTDFGCAEHAFDIAEAYRTIHRLCKPGGLIVADQAVYGTNGFYGFDLSFYEGLAAANGYRKLYSAYVISIWDKPNSFNQYLIPCSRELLKTIDWGKVATIGIIYVMQKTSHADFRMPFQGRSPEQSHGGFDLQFLPSPPSETYVPMFEHTNLWVGQVSVEDRLRQLAEARASFEQSRSVLGDKWTDNILKIIGQQESALQRRGERRSVVICTLPMDVTD